MKSAVAILFVLAAPAFAQDKREDPFKDVEYGHRVEIILKSGFGLMGKLVPYSLRYDEKRVEVIELAKTKTILIDMSLEYPELGGTKAKDASGREVFVPNIVGFERMQVKSVRKLPNLTPEEVKQRERAREDALSRILAEEANRRQQEQESEAAKKKEQQERERKKRMEESKTTEGQLKQAAERIEKGRAAYERFPPPEWGTERAAEIGRKASILRIPLSDDERAFLDALDDWTFYRHYLEGERQPPRPSDPPPTPPPPPPPPPTPEAPPK